MTILFVLLTFLVIMSITYYTRQGHAPEVRPQPLAYASPATPRLSRDYGFEVPQGYCFHPGHTWVLDEGRQNARIGMDSFAANLLGKVERVEVAGLNRWVRQGQKVWSATIDGATVDMVSPVEGVIIAVNSDVLRDPSLLNKDPYKDGWIAVIKSPDLSTNVNNLVRGTFVGPWMQNSLRRVTAMTAQAAGATAQDGGVPISGLLTHVEPGVRQQLVKEFFLT
ncbi:MAG TPA: glycine cleavage system protein H [Terriglobales bacterium]|nr:glycine cleavage system protein H [Terriglobales bacterium]